MVLVPYPLRACIPAVSRERVVVLISIIVFVIVLLRSEFDPGPVPAVVFAMGLLTVNVTLDLLGPASSHGLAAVVGIRPKQR